MQEELGLWIHAQLAIRKKYAGFVGKVAMVIA